MATVIEIAQEKPALVFGAVAVVALLAWLMNRGASGGGGGYIYAAQPAPIDPAVTQIEQAKIAAGTQNVNTLAALISEEYRTDAQERVSLSTIGASKDVSLAQTEANRQLGMYQIGSALEATKYQTDASVDIAGTQAQQQTAAAQITANTLLAGINAQRDVASQQIAAERDVQLYQTEIARKLGQQSFWGHVVGGAFDFLGNLTKYAGF